MVRRLLPAFMLLVAHAAAAQMPPSISKPIEMARKNANATNEQLGAQQAAGVSPNAPAKVQPGAQAQAQAQAKAAPAAPANPAPRPAAKPATQDSTKVSFDREVFFYAKEGRRDPFASPIETGEIRPLVTDLKVVGIIFDASGRNSVAVMRDVSTQLQYRAKVGQILGRAKVMQIKSQEVVLSIDEYGFSRQETLKLNVLQAQQTKGKP